MSPEIIRNTNDYIRDNGHLMHLKCFLNTRNGQIFWSNSKFKKTENVDHIVRVENLDQTVILEYIEKE